MMTAYDRVAVIGCGLIGSGWAVWFLSRGLTVICHDPAPNAEKAVRQNVAAGLAQIGLSEAEQQAALPRLRFAVDLADAVVGVSWIQENAPENLTLKRDLLTKIDSFADPEAIIASSTSSIRMSALQAGMAHPERLVAGHPFLPVTLIPLVEVVGGEATSAAAVDTAMQFYRDIGKQPIRLHREIAGHVANRLQAAVMREAFFLLQEGVASAPDIDLALTEGPGPRWAATGPFVSQQLAGGDGGARQAFHNLGAALRAMWADLGAPELTPKLEDIVVSGSQQCLTHKSASRWTEERLRVVQAVQQEKATLKSDDIAS